MLAVCTESAIAQQLSFADLQWKLTGDSTRVEMFDGRQTLRMETGRAERPDIKFEDGTIDVDVMTSRRRSFVYVSFRGPGVRYSNLVVRPTVVAYDFAARRDGLISLNQARVFLPLRAGANDISIVVADRFGGWGIMGRFPDTTGIRVEP